MVKKLFNIDFEKGHNLQKKIGSLISFQILFINPKLKNIIFINYKLTVYDKNMNARTLNNLNNITGPLANIIISLWKHFWKLPKKYKAIILLIIFIFIRNKYKCSHCGAHNS